MVLDRAAQGNEPMIDKKFAQEFAQEWVSAWNAHDLDAILSHYSDDFEMTSPFISSVAGGTGNTLKGKAAVAEYWKVALEKFPDLKFELSDVLVSQYSLIIYYRSVMNKMAAEIMMFGADGEVVKSIAHYDEI